MTNIIQKLRERLLEYDKNLLIAVCGETGSGKSSSALSIAERIDPDFTVKHLVFNARDFIELLDRDKHELNRGQVIIWDEAGVGLSAKDFQTVTNKAISNITQTFRSRNLAVIFTTPTFKFIDKSVRLLFHQYIETRYINFKKKQVAVKWTTLQYNPRMNKIYEHYYTTEMNGRIVEMNPVMIPKPSAQLWHRYLKKKRRFNDELTKKTYNDIVKIENKRINNGVMQREDLTPYVKMVMKNLDKYKTKNGKAINAEKIMLYTNLGRIKSGRVKIIVEDKLGM